MVEPMPALDQVLQDNHRFVRNLATGLLADPAEADDLMQQTFLEALL